MTRILVTGSNGQLGQCIKNIQDQFNDNEYINADIEDLDITSQSSISSFLKSNKIDFIVNCAAYTAVDRAETEKALCKQINHLGPQLLAKEANELKIKMIHISTDYVFDGTANTPYLETDITNPKSVYGETKKMGEDEVLAINPNNIVIRTSWLYSQYGNNFVKTISRLARDRGTLQVVFDQIGTPTYAQDLAHTILNIINYIKINQPENTGGVYHFSNEGVASWYDFACELINQQQINCHIEPVRTSSFKTAAYRPPYSVLDKNKIKSQFNISIKHWRDSLYQCIKILNSK